MSRIVDNLIAYRVLSMMVTPFEDTAAFKLGIIDKTGKNLKKTSELRTSEERDAYTYLNRLVFNMKKIINRLPGGESKLKTIIAALFLVKEYYTNKDRTTSLMEDKYLRLLEKMEKDGVILVEEEIEVKKFLSKLQEEGEGGAPANNTAGASVNEPVIKKKDVKKYQGTVARRSTIKIAEVK